MKLLPAISFVGLALTIIPSLVHLFGDLSEKSTFTLMAIGMLIWFAAASPWLAFQDNNLDSKTQDYL